MRIVVYLLALASASLASAHNTEYDDFADYRDYVANSQQELPLVQHTDEGTTEQQNELYNAVGEKIPQFHGQRALFGQAKHKSGFTLNGGIAAKGKFIGIGHEDQGTKFEHVVQFRRGGGVDKKGKKKHYNDYDSFGKVQKYGDQKIIAKFGLFGDLHAKGKHGLSGHTDLYGNMVGRGGYVDSDSYGDYETNANGWKENIDSEEATIPKKNNAFKNTNKNAKQLSKNKVNSHIYF